MQKEELNKLCDKLYGYGLSVGRNLKEKGVYTKTKLLKANDVYSAKDYHLLFLEIINLIVASGSSTIDSMLALIEEDEDAKDQMYAHLLSGIHNGTLE